MIRKATPADHARISVVRLAVRENRLDQPTKVAEAARWLYQHSTFWVWEEDCAVQGFSACDPRDGTIFALFVHPDYEARGIGRALLPVACADLKAAGFASATLTTQAASRAERFYRADGRKETGRQADGEIIFEKTW